jgi:hypothetical protein
MSDKEEKKTPKRRGRRPMPEGQAKDPRSPLEVYVNQAERDEITENAERLGMKVSAFLRTAGRLRQPKPIADQATVAAIIHLDRLNIPPSNQTLSSLRGLCEKISGMLDK